MCGNVELSTLPSRNGEKPHAKCHATLISSAVGLFPTRPCFLSLPLPALDKSKQNSLSLKSNRSPNPALLFEPNDASLLFALFQASSSMGSPVCALCGYKAGLRVGRITWMQWMFSAAVRPGQDGYQRVLVEEPPIKIQQGLSNIDRIDASLP